MRTRNARAVTDFEIGQLKAKLAKLKRELLTPSSSGGGAGGELTLSWTLLCYQCQHQAFLAHLS
jgi:ribosome-interacting GTPase 1